MKRSLKQVDDMKPSSYPKEFHTLSTSGREVCHHQPRVSRWRVRCKCQLLYHIKWVGHLIHPTGTLQTPLTTKLENSLRTLIMSSIPQTWPRTSGQGMGATSGPLGYRLPDDIDTTTMQHSTRYYPPSSTPSPDHVRFSLNCVQNIGDSTSELRHPSTLSSLNDLHISTCMLLLLHPLHRFRRNSPWNISPLRARL